MSTDAQHMTRARFAEMERQLAAVTAQRDELMAAVKWARNNPWAHRDNIEAVMVLTIAKVQST